MNMQNSYLTSKPHYEILDGLRGVAAAMVVAFHLLEAHSGGNHLEQIINHGYLAVDFFFMLSGFVIGYAYDDRWSRMSIGTFFKRRIIRLHPMVIVGSIVGAVFFYFQESPCFPAIQDTSVGTMLLVMLLGVYAASASFEMGHSRLDRDASAQRTGLVALLRIHRQYSLCIVHPQVQQDSFIRSRCCGGMFYGAPLSYRTCG